MNFKQLWRGILFFFLWVGFVTNGSSQSSLTNGLVAYYPFNGDANDESGNGNDGTVYGATLTTDRFGHTNCAYYFDGASAYITTPVTSDAFSNDFTVSVWFDAVDIGNPYPTLLFEQNGSLGMGIVGPTSGTSDPNLIGHVDATCSYAPATYSWQMYGPRSPLNNYFQMVVTKTGTNVLMYINGQPTSSNQVTSPSILPGQYLTIGRLDVAAYPAPAYCTFHGVIDDIRVYNRGLSSNEVQQLYAVEAPPVVSLLQAVYPVASNLQVGTNYQMQVSTDLVNWANFGAAFTATNTAWRSPNYWDVTNSSGAFFRFVVSP